MTRKKIIEEAFKMVVIPAPEKRNLEIALQVVSQKSIAAVMPHKKHLKVGEPEIIGYNNCVDDVYTKTKEFLNG